MVTFFKDYNLDIIYKNAYDKTILVSNTDKNTMICIDTWQAEFLEEEIEKLLIS